jgi:MarR family transcriptional regulator for hemolysin
LLKQDFKSDVGYWVHMCAHRFESMMNAELANENISYRQFQVLAWLALEGELSQAELARCSGVEPSTIVSVVDRMERDGLIERQVCPEDRRKYRLIPTPAANPVWKRVLKCAAKVNASATQDLTKAELDQLRSLLERVNTTLEKQQSTDKT